MDKQLIISKFVRFLKNNNVYQHYVACVTSPKCNFESNIIIAKQAYNSLEAFFVNTNPQCFIVHAFSWRKAPQGHNFWSQIDIEWLNYLKNG